MVCAPIHPQIDYLHLINSGINLSNVPLSRLQSDRGHPEGMKFETVYNLVPKAGVLTRSSTQYTFYTAVAELVVSCPDCNEIFKMRLY